MSQTTTEIPGHSSLVESGNAAAALLLEKWLAEEDGYDEHAWPTIERELEDSGLRCRDAYEPSA